MPWSFENRKFTNPYIQKMADHGPWVLSGDQAQNERGQWAAKVFRNHHRIHAEIGTGNGFHFAHYAAKNAQISLVGFEIKFKTLVQTIARARGHDCTNARMVLGAVKDLRSYFADGEIEKLMIHFPDPWPKRKHHKNRLMTVDFLNSAYSVLQPGGIVEFKTDHYEYFTTSATLISQTPFQLISYTEDLHNSLWAAENFKTEFEKLFTKKQKSIYYFALKK